MLDREALINLMSAKYGVTFKCDLPPTIKPKDPVGEFWRKDNSIHLSPEANVFTVLHEVGHYINWQKQKQRKRTKIWLFGLLLMPPSELLALVGFGLYSFLPWILMLLPAYYIVQYEVNDEKLADKYAWEELRRIG